MERVGVVGENVGRITRRVRGRPRTRVRRVHAGGEYADGETARSAGMRVNPALAGIPVVRG